MEDGQSNLKWSNHKTTFFEILKILRENSYYTDATLAVEGKFYPVHKLVMSICSEYFSDIFERTPCKSPVIVLKDVRSKDVEALLDYMYLGEVNVNQSDLASVLKTAECLRIKGLAVPDEFPTESRKNSTSSHDDARWDSPPSKRRRHNSNTIPTCASSPVPSPHKTATTFFKPAQTPSISPHSTSDIQQDESPVLKVELEMDVAEEFIIVPDELPVVKVEMDNTEEQKIFRKENNYEGGASSDRDPGGDYGSDLSKAEHESENYGNTSFPGPSLQQSDANAAWLSDANAAWLSAVRTEGEGVACTFCGKVVHHKWNFFKHFNSHTGEKPFACPYCAFRSSCKAGLKGHIQRFHPNLWECYIKYFNEKKRK